MLLLNIFDKCNSWLEIRIYTYYPFAVWTALMKWVNTIYLWTRVSSVSLLTVNLASLWAWFQIEMSFWHFSILIWRQKSLVERTRMKECLEHKLMDKPRRCHHSLMTLCYLWLWSLCSLRSPRGMEHSPHRWFIFSTYTQGGVTAV